MKLRQLGPSDLHLTPVGLGTWAMGGGDWKFGWGPQDDALSIRTIHEALDLGINWLDTAPVYGLGHCEDVVGLALKELKGRRPIISTKCERCWHYAPDVGVNPAHPTLCGRCDSNLHGAGETRLFA